MKELSLEKTKILNIVSLLLAVAAAGLALFTLVGWHFDIAMLKSININWSSMRPNAALGILFAAANLMFLARINPSSIVRVSAKICALAIGVLGSLTLMEYVFHIDFGIDNLFYSEKLLALNPHDHPRMGPNTAFNFMLMGCALILHGNSRPTLIKLSTFCYLLTFFISFLAFEGYLYGVNSFYGIGAMTKMALHTSIAFIFLSLSGLCIKRESKFVSTILSPAVDGVLLRRLLPLIFIVPLSIGFVVLWGMHDQLLSAEVGASIAILSIISFFILVLWIVAAQLKKIEEERGSFEFELKKKQLEFRHNLANHINGFLVNGPPAYQVMPKVLEIIGTQLGWDYATYLVLNADGTSLSYQCGWAKDPLRVEEFYEETKKLTFAPGVGLPGRTWVSKKVEWISDVTQDSNFPRRHAAQASGLHGAFCFPVAIGEQIIGAVEVFSEKIENPDDYLTSAMHGLGYHIGSYLHRRQMEDSLRESKQLVLQSAKMAALGEMAGAIAHEINTPLNTISFRAFQLIQISEEKQVDDLKKIGEEIESIVFRIAEIVKGLRTIARDGSKDEMKEIGVKGLISSTLSFCRERMASSGVAIEVAPIEDTLVVRGREVELSQVLLNLLNNSFDAVIPLAEKWIHIAIREIDHKVIIIVADSGRGIPAPIREKIMQPFFTTKEIGQGMGIGLSVSKGIMESHHGALHLVDTAPHTTFEMRLPRA